MKPVNSRPKDGGINATAFEDRLDSLGMRIPEAQQEPPISTCSICGYLGYVAQARRSIQRGLEVICERCHAEGVHFPAPKPAESGRKPQLVRRQA